MSHRLSNLIRMIAATTAVLLWPAAVTAAGFNTPDDKYVRTANYYLRAGTDIRPEHHEDLASFDLLVLPAEAQVYNRELFPELRRLNPDIIILAYVPSKSYNYGWIDPLHRELAAGIDDSWWLTDPTGRRVSVWPNTAVLNAVGPWSSYLPQYVRDAIWNTGLWDGVFYDEFSHNISWVNRGEIDLHRDGIRDDPYLADVAWQRSMVNLLRRTREMLGESAVIVTNGDSTAELQPFVNGRMFETFPTPWEGQGRWQDSMANYLRLHEMVGHTPAFIINRNTRDTGRNTDWRDYRYGLCSTLLGDGFYSYDFGESDHGQLWRYDEQAVRLGAPFGGPINLLSPADPAVVAGVWRRDFQYGIALVNSTADRRTVTLESEYERLRGTQDPAVNDGSLVTTLELGPEDGLILLRPLNRIVGSVFPNGAFARIFDERGGRVRNGFFAYERQHPGAAPLILEDLDDDGRLETVVAGNGRISIYEDNGSLKRTFAPYGEAYRLEINFAVGDLEGDGSLEIVTGTGPGAGPHVRVFNRDGVLINPGFFAYDPRFRGGVEVALGDLYGTGRQAIIAGAGYGGGPHVRIFDKTGRLLHPGFFAFDPLFRGGVRVAAGDLDGDGTDEIVTGAGPGGGPHVRVFNGYGRMRGPGFFAADPASREGVRVAAGDLDGDGTDEIAALSTDVFRFSATAGPYGTAR